MMRRQVSRQAGLLIALILLAACGTPAAQPGVPPTPTPTPPSIVATPGRLATPTRTMLVDRGSTPAAATPSISTARQDDLQLELRLDKASFVAGEAGRATVTARNLGTAPATVTGSCGRVAFIEVLDGAGKPLQPPWSELGVDCPPTTRTIPSGEELATTLWYALPPAEGTNTGPYTLRAGTSPGVTGPDNVDRNGPPLVTPPLAVTVTAPAPSQHLRATLLADRAGWRLTATDQAGQVPSAPNWGFIEATAPHTESFGQISESADGCWAGGWGDAFRADASAPIRLRIWLAVPGYVLVAITQDVPPDAGTRLRPLGTPASTCVP